MKIKISSDSTCDLSKEYIEAHDIGILALVVVKDGESYKDGIDITPDVIFEHVNNGGALCSTSAANVNDYMELFEEYKKEYFERIKKIVREEYNKKVKRIEFNVCYLESDSCYLIQWADIVSNSLYKKYNSNDEEFYKK